MMFAGLSEESLVTRLFREFGQNLREFLGNPSLYINQHFLAKDHEGQFGGLRVEAVWTRLIREGGQNARDFAKDPVGYVKAVVSMTEREGRRMELLMWCMAASFFAFASTIGIWLIYRTLINPPPQVALEDKQDLQVIAMLETPIPPPPTQKRGGAGFGAKTPAGGGGGGGNNEPTPASKGRLPKASLTEPQIVAPTTHQRIPEPSLPVSPVVRVDPSLLPPQDMKMPIGDPKGVPGPPSDGPGSGGGIGSGRGGGVGSGEGGGVGPGRGGGIGGGDAGGPGGGGGGPLNLRPTILSQIKPKYTEEARQNKIQGKVVLSVEFRADGTVGDIRIVRSLGYGLDENAISAARQIRFRPAMNNGAPATTRAKVEFSFNLI